MIAIVDDYIVFIFISLIVYFIHTKLITTYQSQYELSLNQKVKVLWIVIVATVFAFLGFINEPVKILT